MSRPPRNIAKRLCNIVEVVLQYGKIVSQYRKAHLLNSAIV